MKRKLQLLLCALAATQLVSAQSEFYVGNDASLNIKANTYLYAAGLLLLPTADYRFSNTELLKSGTVSNYTVQNYVTGATSFSGNLQPFSGWVGYYYSDDNLNGISETALGIKVHNGSYWQNLFTAARNAGSNLVQAAPVSNLRIRELVLADEFVTLPLVWGPVQALRQNDEVRVSWSTRSEQAVSHFQVERSLDGRQWLPAGDAVNANNLSVEQDYRVTDDKAPAQRLYYRIRQQDFDGRFSYSAVVAVAAPGENLFVSVSPNPAPGSFRVLGVDPSTIGKIEIFDTRGAAVMSWSKTQTSYDIRTLVSGVYHVRVHLRTGEIQNTQLIKK